MQLVEERSNSDILRKHESDYLKEMDEIKLEKQRLGDEYCTLQSRYEKLHRSHSEKESVISEYEEKLVYPNLLKFSLIR
jgi:predicted  nucleic acid-binding Zn-ribbon protein